MCPPADPERIAVLCQYRYLLVVPLALSVLACGVAPGRPVAAEQLEIPYLTVRNVRAGAGGEPRYGTTVTDMTGGRCTVRARPGDDIDVIYDGAGQLPVRHVLDGLDLTDDQGLVVYVHGYNIGFERACRDAARLALRTGFEGRLVLFSWPAGRTGLTYGRDARRFAESLPALFEALQALGQRYGPARVNIVAHSMGSRLVTDAIDVLDSGSGPLGHLILVAPDIDRRLFLDILPQLERLVTNVSVLVSDSDRLLLLSQTVNGGPRLGQSGNVSIDGANVIDVSEFDDLGLTGHIYHLDSPSIGRLIGLLLDGPAPDQ